MKKKKITRFPVGRKGYDIDAVESYIALEESKNEETEMALRDRIKQLGEECESLKAQNEELKGREEQIKLCLVTATENANKLTDDVKARYRTELERLRLFRAKWTGAYEQMKDRYHFDKDALNVESVAVSVEIELKKFLMQDFSLNKCASEDEMEAHFRKEVERLTAKQTAMPKVEKDNLSSEDSGLKELMQKTREKKGRDEKNSAAFSLDEALHPELSLDENYRALWGEK